MAGPASITFSGDEPLGRLYTTTMDELLWCQPWEANFVAFGSWWDDQSWTFLAPAMGAVQIPAGVSVHLDLDRDLPDERLAELDALGADAPLDSLAVRSWLESPDALKSLAGLPQLRQLEVESSDLTDDAFAPLASLVRLESLSIEADGLRGAALGFVQSADLRRLSLEWCGLEDGLSALPDHPGLKFLNLAESRVPAGELVALTRTSALEVLDLGSVSVNESDIETIGTLKSLRDLTIPEVDVDWLRHLHALPELSLLVGPDVLDPKTMTMLETFPALKDLRVHLAGATEEDIARLVRLPRLERLRLIVRDEDPDLARLAPLRDFAGDLALWLWGVPQEQLEHIDGLTCLVDVDFDDAVADDFALECLAKATGLRGVTLSKLEHGQVAKLAAIPELSTLDLPDANIDDDAAAGIGALKRLHQLSLHRTAVGDRTANEVADISSLASLLMTGTRITDAGIEHLARCGSLRQLVVNETAITDSAIPSLARLQGLRRLNVGDTAMSPDGVLQLRAAFPNCVIEAHWIPRSTVASET